MSDAPRRVVTALIDWDAATGEYVGVAPGIPGAHSRGATPDEARANLKEVLLALRLKQSKDNGIAPVGAGEGAELQGA